MTMPRGCVITPPSPGFTKRCVLVPPAVVAMRPVKFMDQLLRYCVGAEFALHVAFYPPCATTYREDEQVSTHPIRVVHGTADDWHPIDPCRQYIARLKRAGADASEGAPTEMGISRARGGSCRGVAGAGAGAAAFARTVARVR